MRLIIIALAWAATMIALALGSRAGLLERGLVEFLLLVCPLLAFAALSGRTRCSPAGEP